MSDALRFEWMRIRTIRSTYWLSGLAVVSSMAIALILVLVIDVADRGLAAAQAGLAIGAVPVPGGSFLSFFPIFVAIIGIFATGHEYRYGTIQPTLTTLPQRSALLSAKIIIVTLVAIAAVLVSLAINAGIRLASWGGAPSLGSDPLGQVVLGYLVAVVLYAVLGVALGQLFRGIPTAIVVLLVTPMVVEPIFVALTNIPALDWLVPVVKFLPFSAGDRLTAVSSPEEAFGPGSARYEILDRWEAGGVFAAFVLLILAIAWYLFQRRDA